MTQCGNIQAIPIICYEIFALHCELSIFVTVSVIYFLGEKCGEENFIYLFFLN
jgi:hypothetical protein